MSSPVDILAQVTVDLGRLLSDDTLAGLSDEQRAQALAAFGDVTRLAEAGTVELVATADPDFGHRFGCRGINEMLRRSLLVDAPSAARLVRAADAVQREVNLVSAERMPARWPALREALLDAAVGVTGLLAAIAPLERGRDRITAEQRIWADAHLAAFARGDELPGADDDDHGSAPRASADELRQLATALAMALDPDGAEPTEQRAQSRRSITIGRLRDGVHPVRGNLTPEVAAQWRLIEDAYNNPKVGGAPGPRFAPDADGTGDDDPFNTDPRSVIDPRSAGQRRHDALAAVLGIAARHAEMPMLGGAAPTLVVHVDAADLAAGSGWATIPGAESPVPLPVATHAACAGAIQRVLFDEGRIVGITTTDRVFTVHQRRAIIARDHECLIPGCHVPASWCEIHHVTEHARGGPTHTDNGVPLCWWHHRSLGQSGWEIRMVDGRPQIRGPMWWDVEQRWRTPRRSVLTPPRPRRPQRRRSAHPRAVLQT